MTAYHTLRYYAASGLGRVFSSMRFDTHYGFTIGGNPRDMVSRYIFTFGFWEPNLSEFLVSRITPQTRFYDLGTNIGYFSLLAASRGADVIGVEASPQMAATARANLKGAGFDGEIHNIALAAEEGELILYDRSGPTNTGSRTINETQG
ncbi:MAG: methyltransferase domain-containing protein, partial [Pseudomonadota bacterium]